MEERRDYAVLRFVDQNGWSYMVNDYAKGCSLMEYIKQGIRVEKETVFEWIRQLSKQLEQYYRCGNEDAACEPICSDHNRRRNALSSGYQ